MKEQDQFWSGEFGNEYTARNSDEKIIEANIDFFSKALVKAKGIKTILEIGCNNGMNLLALEYIDSSRLLSGIDVNAQSLIELEAEFTRRGLEVPATYKLSASGIFYTEEKFDLVFTKGVLIHVHPDDLSEVYDRIFDMSARYILLSEYHNPTPIEILYRGFTNRLWKRDFAGEMLDKYPLTMIDYGFVYRRDKHPQDDLTWFLMEKE